MSHAYALHRTITSLAELMRQAVHSHAALAFGAVSVANHAEPLACCDRGTARLRPENRCSPTRKNPSSRVKYPCVYYVGVKTIRTSMHLELVCQ